MSNKTLLNSTNPNSAPVIGGQYNASPPAPSDGQTLPLQQDSAGNLLVNVAVGGGGGGSNASVGLTAVNVPTSATYIGADNPGGKLTGLAVDASGNLFVNVAAGGTSGTQFADNAASGATPTGTLSMGWDSVNSKVRALKVDASQDLLVNVSNATLAVTQSGTWNIGTLTSITNPVAVTGTFFQATQPVSGTFFQATQPVSIAANVGVTQQTSPWIVAGGNAAGSASIANPVISGGSDYGGTPHTQTLKVDSSGQLYIGNFPATQPVSGTVTSNQGGAPWTVKPDGTVWALTGTSANVDVTNTVAVSGTVSITANSAVNVAQWGGTNVSAATAGIPDINLKNVGNAAFALGQQLAASSLPVVLTAAQITTLTPLSTVTANQGGAPWTVKPDGTVWALTGTSANVDVTNTVTVSGTVTANQGGAPWTQNLTQVASTALGATAVVNYGSTPAAVVVPAVNAFVTNTVATTLASTTVTNTVAENLTQVAGTALGSTAVVNFGTAPAAAAVPGANVSLFAGTTGITATGSSLNVDVTNTVTVSGTVTSNQGGAPWTVKPDGTVWALTGTSANVDVTNTVTVSGTVTANQGGAPWSQNVTQFGGNNVATGTGISGVGIPRVTVSSDSFPATQAISALALPLPSNAAQETGGNLATIATQTRNDAQIVDLLNLVVAHLQLLNINTASSIPGADSTIDNLLGVE